MNSECQEGKGGANITPSARKSIHSYCINEMGRYGIKNSQDKTNRSNFSASAEQGTDEVDNVLSKMSRQTSPITIRKNNILTQSNSYPHEEEYPDSSIVLSISLPSTQPSPLYYSDDSDLDDANFPASTSKSRHEDSHHSATLNSSNQSSDYQQRSPYKRKLSISSPISAQRHSEPNKSSIYIILTLVIGIIVAVYFNYNSTILQSLQISNHDKATQTVNYGEILFENNMKNLQEKYNVDHNSILQLKTGLSTIFSRMDAGSFVFLYNSNTNNFNPSQFDKFIDEVANTAARYLRHDISSVKHTVLSSNLDMQEHGELINRYRDDVDKTGVLLVKEVDSVPSDLAMAFHYYCDEYTPLVKRSAIFFTLNLANCSKVSGEKKSTHDVIEKCLARKWTTLPSENLRPLLTRVVDMVIDVTSVF